MSRVCPDTSTHSNLAFNPTHILKSTQTRDPRLIAPDKSSRKFLGSKQASVPAESPTWSTHQPTHSPCSTWRMSSAFKDARCRYGCGQREVWAPAAAEATWRRPRAGVPRSPRRLWSRQHLPWPRTIEFQRMRRVLCIGTTETDRGRRTQRERTERERETYRERQRYRDRDLLLMNSHCYFLLKSSSGEFSALSPSLPSLSQSSSSYTFRDFDAQRQMSQLKYTTRICLCVSACLSVHASLCLHQSLSCKDY